MIDLRTRKLPVWILVLASGVVVVFRICHWEKHTFLWLGGIAVGAVFLLVSKLTDEALGYGDSWMIMLLGIYLGLWDVLLLLSMAFLLSGMMALVFLIRNKWSKKVSFPFVPFLALSYMGVMCL